MRYAAPKRITPPCEKERSRVWDSARPEGRIGGHRSKLTPQQQSEAVRDQKDIFKGQKGRRFRAPIQNPPCDGLAPIGSGFTPNCVQTFSHLICKVTPIHSRIPGLFLISDNLYYVNYSVAAPKSGKKRSPSSKFCLENGLLWEEKFKAELYLPLPPPLERPPPERSPPPGWLVPPPSPRPPFRLKPPPPPLDRLKLPSPPPTFRGPLS